MFRKKSFLPAALLAAAATITCLMSLPAQAQDGDNEHRAYVVRGPSTQNSDDQAWSNYLDSEDEANAKIKDLMHDYYDSDGRMYTSADKPKDLRVEKVRVKDRPARDPAPKNPPPSQELERKNAVIQERARGLADFRARANDYEQWLRNAAQDIANKKATYQQWLAAIVAAKAIWNNRVNPTCDHGHTYADCSCNDGVREKAAMRALIAKAVAGAGQAQQTLSATIQRYNGVLAEYKQLRSQWQQAYNAYQNEVADYQRMQQEAQSSQYTSTGN